MAKAFTSGQTAADIKGEKKINQAGIWIFLTILVLGILMFVVFGGIFATTNPANSGDPAYPTDAR